MCRLAHDYNYISRTRRSLKYWILCQEKTFKRIEILNQELEDLCWEDEDLTNPQQKRDNKLLRNVTIIEIEGKWNYYNRTRMYVEMYKNQLLRDHNYTG